MVDYKIDNNGFKEFRRNITIKDIVSNFIEVEFECYFIVGSN